MDWPKLRESLLGRYRTAELPKWMNVPTFPLAASRFVQAANDPGVEVDTLAEIIESDAGLSVALLRYVNAGVNGRRYKASSVRQAIGLLGVLRSKMIVMGVAAQAALPTPTINDFDGAAFWRRNLQRALFARGLADRLNVDGDTAFTAALLADATLPLLAERHPKLYRSVHVAGGLSQSLDRYEYSMFGYTHVTSAASILLSWGLPDDVVCCVALHHESPRQLLTRGAAGTPAVAVGIATFLPCWFHQTPGGVPELRQFLDIVPGLDLTALVEGIDDTIAAMEPEWDRSDALSELFETVAA